jgi:hypothetical protein
VVYGGSPGLVEARRVGARSRQIPGWLVLARNGGSEAKNQKGTGVRFLSDIFKAELAGGCHVPCISWPYRTIPRRLDELIQLEEKRHMAEDFLY